MRVLNALRALSCDGWPRPLFLCSSRLFRYLPREKQLCCDFRASVIDAITAVYVSTPSLPPRPYSWRLLPELSRKHSKIVVSSAVMDCLPTVCSCVHGAYLEHCELPLAVLVRASALDVWRLF